MPEEETTRAFDETFDAKRDPEEAERERRIAEALEALSQGSFART